MEFCVANTIVCIAYNQCKFGTFCSFSHKAKNPSRNDDDIIEMKNTMKILEEKTKQGEDELKIVNARLKEAEQKQMNLEAELKKILESVKIATGIAMKEATEALSSMISKQQDTIEKQSESSFDALNQQLAMIMKLVQPVNSSQHSSNNHHTALSQSRDKNQTKRNQHKNHVPPWHERPGP